MKMLGCLPSHVRTNSRAFASSRNGGKGGDHVSSCNLLVLEKIVDSEGSGEEAIFPSAISTDGRSYTEELFASAGNIILWKIVVDTQIIQEFTQLSGKAKAAASEVMDAEAILGEILDDFLQTRSMTLSYESASEWFFSVSFKIVRLRYSPIFLSICWYRRKNKLYTTTVL
jgi:hypothetical protein